MLAYRTLTVEDANALCSFRNRELEQVHCLAYLQHMTLPEAEVSFFLREIEETKTRTLVGVFHDGQLVGIGVVVHHGRSKGEVGGYVARAWRDGGVVDGFKAWVTKTWPNYCIMVDVAPEKSLALKALQGTGLTAEVLTEGCLQWKRPA